MKYIERQSYCIFSFPIYGQVSVYYLQAPNYPDSGRCWDIVDKYNVTIFYTAPTLVRSLMRDGDQVSYMSDLSHVSG